MVRDQVRALVFLPMCAKSLRIVDGRHVKEGRCKHGDACDRRGHQTIGIAPITHSMKSEELVYLRAASREDLVQSEERL